MKKVILSLCFLTNALYAASAEAPANHVDMTSAILDFLSRTELCLNSCRDEASAKSAIPQLQQLKQECEKLMNTQRELPEPTVQDYMAVQHQMETFNTIWKAIRDHIERLEQEKLMTQDMRHILHIAPPSI